jgi:hypothetical protein
MLCAWAGAAHAATAADQHRLSFLEQEVRNLQRQVLTLSRQVDELSRPGPMVKRSPSPIVLDSGGSDELPPWVDASLWQKIRPGMSELDAIRLLGKPTSLREAEAGHLLMYALELGPAAFLSGSVTIRDRAVVEVRQPTLQ